MNTLRPSIRHVILDRDGVLNVERSDGRTIDEWSRWQWIDGAREALALLSRVGVRISVATNQSGIGRGSATRGQVDALHARVLADAAQAGGVIDRIWVCPHASDAGCTCRKPLPGLLLQAIAASGIPPDATVAVGDDLRDIEAARAAHLRAMLVRTGKGRATGGRLPPGTIEVFDDLRAVARTMLADTPTGGIAVP